MGKNKESLLFYIENHFHSLHKSTKVLLFGYEGERSSRLSEFWAGEREKKDEREKEEMNKKSLPLGRSARDKRGCLSEPPTHG